MDPITLLRTLIAMNSTPPNPESEGGGGEQQIAQTLKSLLEPQGFEVKLQEVLPGRPNVIALPKPYFPNLPLFILEAHMDTVGIENMTIHPFQAEIREGKVFGRGACDTKGTMAAMLAALIRFRQTGLNMKWNLGFVATMDEESGGTGAQHLMKSGFKPDAVLIAEPTDLHPVIAHKGLLRFAIVSEGRACHSSRPQEGENAIDTMWQVQKDLFHQFAPFWTDLSGTRENTISLNTIHGGSFINVVPDRCRIEVDCRYTADTDLDRALAKLKAVVLNHLKTRLEILKCLPAFSIEGNSPLLAALERALQQHGLVAERRKEPWFADAAFFSQAGCDTIIWGAGSIAQAHTANEYIEIEQLQLASKILTSLLAIIASGSFLNGE